MIITAGYSLTEAADRDAGRVAGLVGNG
jgi:hypothetical protein